MKNIIYLGTFLSLVFIVVNCSNSPKESRKNTREDTMKTLPSEVGLTTNSTMVTPHDTIPVDTLKAWVKNWRDHGKSWMATDSLKYFNMPLIDLREVYGENGVDSARFYLGMEMQNGSYMPKLILIGLDSTGKKMLNASKGQYAYDLSRPCPPLCKE